MPRAVVVETKLDTHQINTSLSRVCSCFLWQILSLQSSPLHQSSHMSKLNCPQSFPQVVSQIKFIFLSPSLQLKDVNRHPWACAGSKGELELEAPMMEVVQTHIIPNRSGKRKKQTNRTEQKKSSVRIFFYKITLVRSTYKVRKTLFKGQRAKAQRT